MTIFSISRPSPSHFWRNGVIVVNWPPGTIVFAARENIWAVVFAGILGHALCTGLAVLGGRMIAQRISVRTVTIIGGFVFIAFALTALFLDPNVDN